MVREKLICFVADENEKKAISSNATTRGFGSMSAFIRSRTVRPEMTNNELADMLMDYIWKTCAGKKEGVKTPITRVIPSKPPVEILPEMVGLSAEQQEKMSEYIQRKKFARLELMTELKKCLAARKPLEDCTIDVLEEK